MSASNDIEVWLIKVPQNGMYVPYHVTIPTPYGTATATSTAPASRKRRVRLPFLSMETL